MQLPIGAGEDFEGVIDLITLQALYFDGKDGETVRADSIPAHMMAEAEQARQSMLESLSMFSDELMELLLSEEEVPEELIHRVLRDAVRNEEITPVFLGTAYRNKGVQPLLNAIVRYLPSPLDGRSTHSIATTRTDGWSCILIRNGRLWGWPSKSSTTLMVS